MTTAGPLIRSWRQRRNLSQLDLATRADVSTRHLSYIENGRSRPTSGMLMKLCTHLDMPLREQNQVLLAGGYAPAYPEHSLSAPPMAEANAAVEAILAGHLPYPALAVDRYWDLVAANDAVWTLLEGVSAEDLEPPVNVLRLSVDPGGLAPFIENLPEWRGSLLLRLAREFDAAPDDRLAALIDDIRASGPASATDSSAIVVPLRLRRGDTVLSFISATTVFGTAREVTLSELAIEAFYPADAATRTALAGT
ncbi:helix-turn-helix domain-containing protein [Gordonia amarae]|uniref:Helix-turn-helix domain-containing protein n=2 Tax=Gordonia amarae TaxID=36821 RepID=A0A857M8R5_9ACTN|nr:helix-turn-helix transcriptional regulator [Gordonia amarae]MCS3876742.1 transcriptional regulator with XRE-family HTH domain [Gordonia amarae]QHN15594.1 helix-turn-helix domain-containing protein [Gordonia amarae]QHN20164.1 helix-turn-helix domain-containing protein [Gordonia amarae]QHN29014.1 helix-turn-helix domain-containing protein [Gordonia amarae]QHN37795.1 helix-turn-helix domain-containing protein [Gordonia amarae]